MPPTRYRHYESDNEEGDDKKRLSASHQHINLRRARAKRIFKTLRETAEPGTTIVLGSEKPLSKSGGATHQVVFFVAAPYKIVKGSPSSPYFLSNLKDFDDRSVQKSFLSAASWLRFLSLYSRDGRIVKAYDLDDLHARFDLPVIQQAKMLDSMMNDDQSKIMTYLRDNWKMVAGGSSLLLVAILIFFFYWKK